MIYLPIRSTVPETTISAELVKKFSYLYGSVTSFTLLTEAHNWNLP
jgi:hypothetical protein